MNDNIKDSVAIIGGGLAGCECALALARLGIKSTIFEMKPEQFSPAHSSAGLAELVCSNSLRSDDPQSAVGVLKNEMRVLHSAVMQIAEQCRVPAGKALAVDRDAFSRNMTKMVEENPLISLTRQEIKSLKPDEEALLQNFTYIVLAAGPLASESISMSLGQLTGLGHLYFYDAIAPIVEGDSLNMDIIFRASRYSDDEGDYLNCPMNKEEYYAFYSALTEAQKAPTKDFERESHFEGCMPIEALAERGEKTLTFGPLKPVGFTDPRTNKRPYAIVQLRAENLNRSMYNLVGCQTKLLYKEQDRVFRLIPGLENAEFVRYGSMHRNTYINAPQCLNDNLSLKSAPNIFLAGQITGVEGYVESAACGLWLGLSLGAKILGHNLTLPPQESSLGALLAHLRTPVKKFQPSNVQYGLMPELGEKARKADRKFLYSQRAKEEFNVWLNEALIKTLPQTQRNGGSV